MECAYYYGPTTICLLLFAYYYGPSTKPTAVPLPLEAAAPTRQSPIPTYTNPALQVLEVVSRSKCDSMQNQ